MRARTKQQVIPPLLERYELKYVIPNSMIEPISEFISIYCSLDKYSKNTENGFYRINNLYFDTPNYLFLKRRLDGADNRFNMRIRSYSDTCPVPCFFEIKQKRYDIIKKFRAIVEDSDWPMLFQNRNDNLSEKYSVATSNKSLFLKLAYSYQASPKVLTQYFRKAYVSDIDDYARVTFDKELRYRHEHDYNLVVQEEQMTPLDNETLYNPGCDIILELKCYSTQVPLWMMDLIRLFQLSRRGFSKYVTGIREIMNYIRYDNYNRVSTIRLDFY